jgi:KDO2-lipid IV(A) lauroyltransferase
MRLGRAVGAMAHLAAGEERRIAKRNLEIVKEETFIARRGRGLARRSFVELGANLAEAAHAARWTLDDYRRRIDFDGVEHWRAAFERARGVIVVSAHLGAWELIAPALLAHVVAQPPPAGIPQIEAIARPARNARIDALARRLRERFGLKVHAREGLQLGYLRTLSRGGALLVLGDQYTRRAEAIAVRFFGRPTMTPVGPAWLARRTGAAVLPAFIERRKDDPTRHRLAFKAPIFPDDRLDEEADRFRMTQAATREIEAAIRATPEGWTWMHDRWMRDPKKMLRDEEIELGANERRMEGGEEGS